MEIEHFYAQQTSAAPLPKAKASKLAARLIEKLDTQLNRDGWTVVAPDYFLQYRLELPLAASVAYFHGPFRVVQNYSIFGYGDDPNEYAVRVDVLARKRKA